MDNETFINEIKIRRNLEGVIKNLLILAVRVFEIEKHLGITKPEKTDE